MTSNDLLTRLNNCQQNKLCFISLLPLAGNDPVIQVYHPILQKAIRILRKYDKTQLNMEENQK